MREEADRFTPLKSVVNGTVTSWFGWVFKTMVSIEVPPSSEVVSLSETIYKPGVPLAVIFNVTVRLSVSSSTTKLFDSPKESGLYPSSSI